MGFPVVQVNKMANTMKKESDVQVTYEDQKKINEFARTNSRLMDAKEELVAKEKQLQNLTDAEDELLMAEGDDLVPYMIGEVLVDMTPDDAQSQLNKAKDLVNEEIGSLKKKADGFKDTLSDLKTQLYAKFGTNINLDMDDDS